MRFSGSESHDRSGRAVSVANSLPGHGHVGPSPAPGPRRRGRAAAAARRRAGRRPRAGAAAGGGWGSERPWLAARIGRRGRKQQRKQPLSERARPQRQPSEAGRGAGGARTLSASPPSRDRARIRPPIGPLDAPPSTEPPTDESHRQTQPATDAVPPDGWRPMEAAEALCPDAAALYQRGGEALDAAMGDELHRLSVRANRSPEIRPDAWLTLQLLDALRGRPDLRLTGRNPYDPLAPRTTVPPDVLQDACERDNRDQATRRRWVQIRLPRWPRSPAAMTCRRRTQRYAALALGRRPNRGVQRLAGAAGRVRWRRRRGGQAEVHPREMQGMVAVARRGLAEGQAPADRRGVPGLRPARISPATSRATRSTSSGQPLCRRGGRSGPARLGPRNFRRGGGRANA